MRRTGKRSESPYNEASTTGPAVQGVYNYQDLASSLIIGPPLVRLVVRLDSGRD